jgi:hypothetical protein
LKWTTFRAFDDSWWRGTQKMFLTFSGYHLTGGCSGFNYHIVLNGLYS